MNPALFWALCGLILIASEMLIPGFTIFFFGLGALLNALLILIFPGMGTTLQGILWLASSLTLFALMRKYFRRIFGGTLICRDDNAAQNAGREAVVIEEIGPEKPGRIRFQGTSWEASSYDETIATGERAMILRQEGMRFIVSRPFPEADIDDQSRDS